MIRTHAMLSVITLESSHTTSPTFAVTPASLFPCTAISVADTVDGRTEGSVKRVRYRARNSGSYMQGRVRLRALPCTLPCICVHLHAFLRALACHLRAFACAYMPLPCTFACCCVHFRALLRAVPCTFPCICVLMPCTYM